MQKLTAAALASLPIGDHLDHIIPGLVFRVGARRRSWMLRYRAGGKQNKPVIGYFPETGLKEAREAAKAILERLEAGVPVVEQKPVHPKDAMTLGTLVGKYEKMKRAKGGRGTKSLDEAMRTVRRLLADYLDLPARQFTKADLKKARDKMAKGVRKSGTLQMSDRAMTYLSAVLNWAAKEDHIETNLVSVTHKVGPGTVKRKRVLTNDEIRAIWTACPKMSGVAGKSYGRMIRFLLVTAQRLDEAALLKHGSIIDGRWKQTEDDNKSSREHLLKLPPLALDQLSTGTADELCFASRNGKRLSGISNFKRELDRLSGVSGWRTHDLRRTATTSMQNMVDADEMPLIGQDVISAIMNHAIKGADGHYLHGTMNRAKSRALELWADELKKILKIVGNIRQQ